jgi:hypothetical protein
MPTTSTSGAALAAPAHAPSPMTLWDIEDDLQALLNSVDTASPEQERELQAAIADAMRTAVAKRERVYRWIAHCRAMEAAAKAEIERLRQRMAAFERARERVEEYVVEIIDAIGPDEKGKYPKLQAETATFSVARNPGHVEITDENLVPDAFKRATVTLPLAAWLALSRLAGTVADPVEAKVSIGLDRSAVKVAIQSGADIPGATLAIGDLRLVVK